MLTFFLCLLVVFPAFPQTERLADVRIRILSTMLTGSAGIGEWGFAAVVEAGGRSVLFDTGARPETVWKNASELNIDLSPITDVILSHNHGDHTGGLVTLRGEMAKRNPKALSKAHAGEGILWPRPGPGGEERNHLRKMRAGYEALGGSIAMYGKPAEIFPGMWLTGPVERRHQERNWSGDGLLIRADGSKAEDTLPEDMSLVLDTARGLVIVTGCGHAGIINILEQARRIRNAPIFAVIGGLHLFNATDKHLEWTAGKLKEFEVKNLLGTHCTGIEAVYRLRQLTGLTRRSCAAGAVGGGFTLKDGLLPGAIAR
jgi:7,8-dihydropterin-6-yl-methyl-4-(beta-D-ribofuranosyl)aminobenzene 5'-phosphate synthase